MFTKSRLWSYGWTLNFSKKSQNNDSKPILEKMVEKVAPDVLTQPLKTRKSSVWCKRNTSFQLSNFAAT